MTVIRGKGQAENGSLIDLGGESDDPFMFFHDAGGNGQAEAGAGVFGRKERVEDSLGDFRGNAPSRVADFENDGRDSGGRLLAGIQGASVEGNRSILPDAIGGVLDEVDQDLLDLLSVRGDGQSRFSLGAQRDAARGEFHLEQLADVRQETFDRDLSDFRIGRPGELEEIA
jgi:hypothetical protein